MRRLQLLLLVSLCIFSLPLFYFVLQTYRSLEQEELAELRYFVETLFNEMESELGSVVVREEGRAIDAYQYQAAQVAAGEEPKQTQQARFPQEPYILGYLQNNPDGSFQTSLIQPQDNNTADVILQLNKINEEFNQQKALFPAEHEPSSPQIYVKREKVQTPSFAEKYLQLSRFRQPADSLVHNKRRVEYISVRQGLNITNPEEWKTIARMLQVQKGGQDSSGLNERINQRLRELTTHEDYTYANIMQANPGSGLTDASMQMRVELDPMQSVLINDDIAYVFRRILLNGKTYHQGAVIKLGYLLKHLTDKYFIDQPMARFARLSLKVIGRDHDVTVLHSGIYTSRPLLSIDHIFSAPFSFLHATLSYDQIPHSPGRAKLNIMMSILVAVILIGALGIYKSVQAVIELSERRSRFISSVTHELKTPLSNICMYIEMLEQGVARNQEHELEYFRILGAEGNRLSRLITSVLDFARLERKQWRFNLAEGTFEDVIRETSSIMREKLREEGFELQADTGHARPFKYDREAMVQVLTNLVDNSIKFGKASPVKRIAIRLQPEGRWMKIDVADTGPGIPRQALKKVFEDFYRVDSDLTRSIRGTGIGLALVKKFVAAMGGTVTASPNNGPGCTISIALPL